MKMAYETPKMKVELFQTNAYCDQTCGLAMMKGYVTVEAIINKVKEIFTFYTEDKVVSLNQYSHQKQYYYEWENNDTAGTKYYLEWSAHQNGAFILYEETANSGYYNSQTLGDYVKDDYGNVIGDGSNTLQTNTGYSWSNPAFSTNATWHDESKKDDEDYAGTEFLYNGEAVHANVWYADRCLGQVSPVFTEDQTWEIVNS